jgi:hypothetical protein
VEAPFRVTEAKHCTNGRKGCKPLQADRCRSNGPTLDGREGEDRNGEYEKPCGSAEENF